MDMSPQRIRSAEFKTVRKGLDPDEVRLFLNDVADELEQAQNQSTAMEARARAAVARLQEATGADAAPAAGATPAAEVPSDQAEAISKTLILAQRTADATVAEANDEAARIVAAAKDEANSTLDSTREMAAKLVDDAREDARRSGETERAALASEVEALMAKRDFLYGDVAHLEQFLEDQRSRMREAATEIIALADRVPGGLGETRPPVLSAAGDPVDDVTVTSDETGAIEVDPADLDRADVDRAAVDRADVDDVTASGPTDAAAMPAPEQLIGDPTPMSLPAPPPLERDS